ncbi:Cytochrome P450 monooxygenase 71 [Psilocybe cubensis]|uniref:Cytochrome P450 n=2 Tax=Psilocybe cubensis TaxID=181762 RepID=A0A8H7XMZ6_PSICU|nr:Cytochrome P450 monooxygenase 71 [Psilocybe cubensis]KAH9477540.1 Cytochrome P450 monooxygenase 71 [Psilocybe cubensis]
MVFLSKKHVKIDLPFCEKYRDAAFKISNIGRWVVMVSGSQMLEDIRRASEDQLSFDDAVGEISEDPYHVAIVRTSLTRNIGTRFADIHDEILTAFSELIPTSNNSWTLVPALETVMHIVCRTSNRLFVGLPLCRQPDYVKLNEQFTVNVVLRGNVIRMFPPFIRPIMGRLLSTVSSDTKLAVSHLQPYIEKQVDCIQAGGVPQNDFIYWLLEVAKGSQRTVHDISLRLLAINFAAIHTTSHALTHALYYLATYPEYAEPMREEVRVVTNEEGWTKMAMDKLHKVDSFVRESQRLTAGGVALARKVLKDFSFSNGVTVPAGTHIAFCSYSTHTDERNYPHAREFQGFRFADLRDKASTDLGKHQIVSLSPDNVTFGIGRHACPGRFFAANELKAMIAYIVLSYDVKLPDECNGKRPPDLWIGANPIPNMKAKLLFKRR